MFWKWCKKIGLGFLCMVVFLLMIGAAYQWINTKIDEKRYPATGQMIDVGGYKLHLQSKGSGGPAVVIDTGLGDISATWSPIQSEIAKFTQVVTYDRAGIGWSESSPFPRTSQQIVHELHELLTRAHIPKPYILVGHSFGGINVQLYAATYPEDVQGLVLVDSGHEEQPEKLPPLPQGKKISRLFSLYDLSPNLVYITSVLGISRIFSHLDLGDFKSLVPCSDSEAQMRLALTSTTKHVYSVNLECNLSNESLQQLKKTDRSLINDLPCFVLELKRAMQLSNHKLSEEEQVAVHEWEKIWKGFQRDTASKFHNSRLIVAEKSDHLIQWHQPELIVHCVKELVNEKRNQKQ